MLHELIFVLGFPLLRGLMGWIENALEDGYIDLPEWKELSHTVIRIATPVLIIYTGVTVVGADQAITIFSAAAASIIDILWNKYRNAAL